MLECRAPGREFKCEKIVLRTCILLTCDLELQTDVSSDT